ncbi:unnamed protein product [Absidia cylindrospora]
MNHQKLVSRIDHDANANMATKWMIVISQLSHTTVHLPLGALIQYPRKKRHISHSGCHHSPHSKTTNISVNQPLNPAPTKYREVIHHSPWTYILLLHHTLGQLLTIRGSNEQMVSTPENSYGHLDIEEHLDTPTEKWTTLSNADFSSRTQQPSRYLSSITDTPEKLQQQPPNVDDESYDKDDRYHGDSQHWLPPQTQPQPHMQPQSQPAIDNIGKIVDSKDEDHGDLAGSQGPYKQLEDDQILQALSWTLSNSVGGSQSVHSGRTNMEIILMNLKQHQDWNWIAKWKHQHGLQQMMIRMEQGTCK